jgi:type II secretory ATPase GspE/PulE/Tfp pilus assembly ATPase PilB-like protein
MLRDDGLRWVIAGETTLAEVLRVTRATDEELAS